MTYRVFKVIDPNAYRSGELEWQGEYVPIGTILVPMSADQFADRALATEFVDSPAEVSYITRPIGGVELSAA